MPSVSVHFLPRLTDPRALAGSDAVVIDVLRASTTIIEALANGAAEVIPLLSVARARRLRNEFADQAVLLGGERQGRRIRGFDLGNSPSEYHAARVAGTRILFTTTNGTRALARCHLAARVVVGALTNRRAVCEAIGDFARLHVVCAGTRGEISYEDLLGAGAILEGLSERASAPIDWCDAARAARGLWRQALAEADMKGLSHGAHLNQLLAQTQGGRNVLALGLSDDVAAAARLDRSSIVPRLDATSGAIRAA